MSLCQLNFDIKSNVTQLQRKEIITILLAINIFSLDHHYYYLIIKSEFCNWHCN